MTMFTLGAAWGTVIEVGRNHVGVVGATMNSVGNLAAMLNPLIVAYSVQWFGNWNLPLLSHGRAVPGRRGLLDGRGSDATGVRRAAADSRGAAISVA